MSVASSAADRPAYLDLPQQLGARGTVSLPGSKSISNRVLLLAALADGDTEVRDLLDSDDTQRMLEALRTLGLRVDSLGGNRWRIGGCGGRFPVKSADIFLGNAGTAFRPLTAALALAGGSYTLRGVPRMHERPIGDLVDALRQLGAEITYLGETGFPPLAIAPTTSLNAGGLIRVRGDVSSQFLTGLLMALPLLGQEITVEVSGELISKPYVEITLATMARFGVQLAREGWSRFTVSAHARYVSPGVVYVEGDASSASYFLALGAIGGGPVRVEGVGKDSIQGDIRFAEALANMGAVIEMGENWIEAKAPAEGLRGIDLDCNHIPDAAMTLAVAALFARGETVLRNIASWRVKETDRIAAMATELRKLGGKVEEHEDAIRVSPLAEKSNPVSAAVIDTYDDHRMAMCFSLAALATPLRINDPACVAKTFPHYFSEFARICSAAPVIAIDGPSASGKGTVAARVAAQLGFAYLDSGALYRLVALAALRAAVPWDNEAKVADLASTLPVRFVGQQIFLGQDDVSEAIRSEVMSSGASQVASLPAVRQALLFRQRIFQRRPGLVGDGRDMGSVVFPQAKLKVFLTASAEVRGQRRYKQLVNNGLSADLSAIVADLKARDERDSQRSCAPLQKLADAHVLDTSELTIEQAVSQVLAWYAESAK